MFYRLIVQNMIEGIRKQNGDTDTYKLITLRSVEWYKKDRQKREEKEARQVLSKRNRAREGARERKRKTKDRKRKEDRR